MAKKPQTIKRSWVQERKPFERENSNTEFYNSWPWRKLRKRFLAANPLCVDCEAKDMITKSTVADHIVRINAGGEPLNEKNLQALCEHHHNKKSAFESRK
ncbi:MAG: 5-methylcytosine-specific restriction protein A [Polaribacter sp.]|jgi:5-methylcytosine-specific restriction protein A